MEVVCGLYPCYNAGCDPIKSFFQAIDERGATMKLQTITLCFLLLFVLGGCQKEPTTEYRLPADAQWYIGKDSYPKAGDHMAADTSAAVKLDKKYGQKAVLDGEYLLLEASDAQKQAVIDCNTALAEQGVRAFEALSDRHTVEWSEDFSTVTYFFDYPSCISPGAEETLQDLSHLVWIDHILLTNRILTTGDCDAPIRVIYKNPESGHVLASGLYPYEPLVVGQEDWEQSNLQDVSRSSRYADYADLSMTVREVSPDKILFTPQATDGFYGEDEQLCLCLDSVYADEVVVPYPH